MSKSLFLSIYLKILVRNPSFLIFLGLVLLLTFHAIPQTEIVKIPEVVEMFILGYFVSFIILAFMAIAIGDVVKTLKFSSQPLVKSFSISLFFTLINLIPLSPAIFYTTYLISTTAPYPLSVFLFIYLISIGLAIASISLRLNVIFIIFSTGVITLFPNVSTQFVSVMAALALSTLIARVIFLIIDRLPHVLLLERLNATFSLHIALTVVLTYIALLLLSYILDVKKSFIGTPLMFFYGIKLVGNLDITAFLLILAITFHISFMPALFNAANRYVDAYIWHLKALHGTSWQERILKTLFYFSAPSGVVIPLLILSTATGLIEGVGLIFASLAAGTAVGIFILNRLETDNDVGKNLVVYWALTLGIWYIFGTPMEVSNMPLLDIALTTLLLTAAFMLYDLPIKLKKALLPAKI